MATPLDRSSLLIAFAHAASKAQEIEALLQETVILAEVAHDTQKRSLADIAKKIGKMPLGALKDQYLKTIGKQTADADPVFAKMWKNLNQERIFLMHRFFTAFPVTELKDNHEAAMRLQKIDKVLDIGRRFLNDTIQMTLAQFNLQPATLRKLLETITEQRRSGNIADE